MLNEFITWFESQWHIIAPILIAGLPSLGVVGGIINSAKNLIKNNKSLVNNVINQVKEVNEGAFKEIINQVSNLVTNLTKEINVLKNDNQLMAQIVSKVILSKNVNTNVKEEIVLLAKGMSTTVVKDVVTKEQEPIKEIKLAEVKEIKLDPVIEETNNTAMPYVPIND
jgi:hypothetical protein